MKYMSQSEMESFLRSNDHNYNAPITIRKLKEILHETYTDVQLHNIEYETIKSNENSIKEIIKNQNELSDKINKLTMIYENINKLISKQEKQEEYIKELNNKIDDIYNYQPNKNNIDIQNSTKKTYIITIDNKDYIVHKGFDIVKTVISHIGVENIHSNRKMIYRTTKIKNERIDVPIIVTEYDNYDGIKYKDIILSDNINLYSKFDDRYYICGNMSIEQCIKKAKWICDQYNIEFQCNTK